MSNDAAWRNDPYGRFQLRYWDGAKWTEHVATGGEQQVDPMGASAVIPFATPASAFPPPAGPAAAAPADTDADDQPAAASTTQELLDSVPADERYDEAVYSDEPGADL